MDILYIIAFIFLIIKYSSLSQRIEGLEKNNREAGALVDNRRVPEHSSSDARMSQAEPVPQKESEVKVGGAQSVAENDNFSPSRFIEWYKNDWMLKTGALLLLLGLGWFVTYAFMENWIGPLGRITLGYALGALVLYYGWKKMHDESILKQSSIVFALGAAIIILTTYAGRSVYEMFTSFTTVAIIFIVSMFVSLSAVRFEKSLAYVGLFMGALAPMLSDSGSGDYILLFAYLLVLILGSHLIVHITGKRGIILAGMVVVAFYSFPYLTSSYRYVVVDYGVLLLFAYAFAALFFLASIIGVLRSASEKNFTIIKADLIIALGTAMYLIAWVTRAGADGYKGLILVSWMLIFVVGAYLLFLRVKERSIFYAYALVGILLLGTATSIELGGMTRLIAFTVEASAIVLGTHYLLRERRVTKTLSGFFVVPILFSFEYLFGRIDFFDAETLALLLLAFAMLGLAYLFYKEEGSKDEEVKDYDQFKFFLIGGSLYFWTIVWRNSEALLGGGGGNMLGLIVFTVAGIGLYLYGKIRESKGTVLYGSTLVLFVIAHLVIIDIWRMDLAGKVITFILVGALLMVSAFIGKKK